jgi:hypothetical protein
MTDDKYQLAQAIREACVETALHAYEEAGISGLCGEGRWEYAIQALKGLDLGKVIRQAMDSADAASPSTDDESERPTR